MVWNKFKNLYLGLAALSLALPVTATSAELARHLSLDDVNARLEAYQLVDNSAFVPGPAAKSALQEFQGALQLSETEILSKPAVFKSADVFGKKTGIFPGVKLSFVSHDGTLIPQSQDVIRYGSLSGNRSYWDIIVQAGKTWSEEQDGGWSRASFPFALMNSVEGETHNGVATFLYKDKSVSAVRYQIVSQTAPFYMADIFTASGTLAAKYDAAPIPGREQIVTRFLEREKKRGKIERWDALAKKFGAKNVDNFDTTIPPDQLVADALHVDDTLYIKSCPTVAGELPYCDRQRFGVWSVTKSAALGVALLRVAEQFDPDILDRKISDYVTEARAYQGWVDVKFGDAYSMATGMGYGSKDPGNGISDPFDGVYLDWYVSRSASQKLERMFKDGKPYPWGPGKHARYRDEDMFLLGVAIDRYLKQKVGPEETVWGYLNREVYGPLGIPDLPTNRTIEQDPAADQPLMAYGLYATLDELAKIGKLYQEEGRWNGKQLLSAKLIKELLPQPDPVGFETKSHSGSHYYRAFWFTQYKSEKCSFYYPFMDGWGANYVSLLPNKVTTIRIARTLDDNAGAIDQSSMTAVADVIRPLCP